MVVDFDPVIFGLGPLQVRWYGLMYVIGFIISGFLLRILVNKGFFQVSKEKVDSLITHAIVGMFLGARSAYVVIYNWDYYSQNLIESFYVWQGGLSFHGALTGILIGGYVFARRNKISWAEVMDCVALSGAQGLFFGRIGNFINGELYGRITTSPFGMIFPNSNGLYPRHPSQLYEALMEGVILSIILWVVLKRVKIYGVLASLFLVGYGCFRFIVEFFREPDSQLGFYFGFFTMGQILCSVMIAVGVGCLFWVYKLNIRVSPNFSQREFPKEI